ncbi:MAG: hypothetical protein ACKVXR_16990 [Planctomycetota bacterium]
MSIARADRRSVLLAGGAGLAAFAAPAWIQRAFARQQEGSSVPDKSPEPETVARALERATAIGKPLMVIVVPAEDLRLERGRLWGDLFAFAPEAAMADFALCEWTCASAADLVRAVPALEGKLARETLAVLIETEDAAAKTRLLTFRLGDLEPQRMGGFPVKQMKERGEELARLLQGAILPGPEAWKLRHLQSARANAPLGGESALLHESDLRPRLRLVDRHAAVVRAQAESWPNGRANRIASLAQAAALRLWESEPPGAAWKTEHVDACPPCGMGHMPGSSRAFLEFYVQKGR